MALLQELKMLEKLENMEVISMTLKFTLWSFYYLVTNLIYNFQKKGTQYFY